MSGRARKQGDPARILVIKHGALGDFILATGPFTAIRRRHVGAEITLLTTAPFEAPARQSGYFDAVWVDEKPSWYRWRSLLAFRRRLADGQFGRVYDLQTSGRSSLYFRLFRRPKPEWSGIAAGCSHPHANPVRDRMHTLERQAEQLAIAGLADAPPPDVTWLDSDISELGLANNIALLVPGGAPHRPAKRWPPARYGALAQHLAKQGLQPVVIGTAADGKELAAIFEACPDALNLVGKTDLGAIAALARCAQLAVGSDTGPMHIIAVATCPALVLFSHESDPALSAPRGPRVAILRRPSLEELGVKEVLDHAMRLSAVE
jgi:ADP-heptose:LPS heptosyltransferase